MTLDPANVGDALIAAMHLPDGCDLAALAAAVRALSPADALAALVCAAGLLAIPEETSNG